VNGRFNLFLNFTETEAQSKRMNYAHEIDTICRRYGIADLYVFGSRGAEIAALVRGQAPGDTLPQSDVDIAVLPAKPQSFGLAERVELAIALEDLFDAPRVDLVVLTEADPFLALEAIRGELLYTDDPDRQARYELYILRRAGDLSHLKKERLRMILEEGAR
jgi:predicted nucleotidyltransferase